jgi:hypothetical protein
MILACVEAFGMGFYGQGWGHGVGVHLLLLPIWLYPFVWNLPISRKCSWRFGAGVVDCLVAYLKGI